MPGYHNLINCTRNDDNRGGVGLFACENITFNVRDDLSVFIPHIFESLFIEIGTSENNHDKNIIGLIYRPNTQPKVDIDIFSSTLQDIMDSINNENKSCLLMGDFNIDILKYNLHNKTNDFVDSIFGKVFLPQILKPTRITKSTATLIDHIYSNDILLNSASGIIINDVADHFGTFHIIKNKSKTIPVKTIKKRIFSKL